MKLYVYPFIGQSGELVTADNFLTRQSRAPLQSSHHEWLHRAIEGYQQDYLKIRSSEVLAKIRAGDSQWEKSVSPEVASIIRDRRLFGFSETPTAEPAGVA